MSDLKYYIDASEAIEKAIKAWGIDSTLSYLEGYVFSLKKRQVKEPRAYESDKDATESTDWNNIDGINRTAEDQHE